MKFWPWGRSPGNLFLDKFWLDLDNFWLNLENFWLNLDKLGLKWIKSLLYSDKFGRSWNGWIYPELLDFINPWKNLWKTLPNSLLCQKLLFPYVLPLAQPGSCWNRPIEKWETLSSSFFCSHFLASTMALSSTKPGKPKRCETWTADVRVQWCSMGWKQDCILAVGLNLRELHVAARDSL